MSRHAMCLRLPVYDHDESIKPLVLDHSKFSQTHKITNIGIIICHSIDLQLKHNASTSASEAIIFEKIQLRVVLTNLKTFGP